MNLKLHTHARMKSLEFSLEECRYLEKLAPHFDIGVNKLSDTQVELCIDSASGTKRTVIPRESLYPRLLSELCSKTLKWVTYRQSEPVAATFFGVSEGRMMRIAQLYLKSKKV